MHVITHSKRRIKNKVTVKTLGLIRANLYRVKYAKK